MSAQTIEAWADSRIQTFPLSTLSGACIGVDAAYYLDLRLNKQSAVEHKDNPSRNSPKTSLEPLFNALGGIPLTLRQTIGEDIQALKKLDVSLLFIFNGLDYLTKELPPVSKTEANLEAHKEGWQHYLGNTEDDSTKDELAKSAVNAFGKAGGTPLNGSGIRAEILPEYPVELLYRYFQNLLQDMGVQYMVAPYSAIAQLSYLDKQPEQFIDAVMGSTECFLFNVSKVILDFNHRNSSFTWLSKSACQDSLDSRMSDNLFRDIQLLLGSSFLPTFPMLGRNTRGPATVREVSLLLNNWGRNVTQLCQHYRDDPQVQLLQYGERYKKAVMTIRHHVVLETNGNIGPMDFDRAPGDVHEFVGQKLPEELFFYMSKGILGAQIPNWLTSGEISLTIPAGAIDSESYRRLVVVELNQLRATTLKLMSESLHRYYQRRTIKVRPWYDREAGSLEISIKDEPAIAGQLNIWKIHDEDIPGPAKEALSTKPLRAALKCMEDKSFTAQITAKDDSSILRTPSEIKFNVLWRFLQIRGYINEKHELTPWGKALEAALTELDPDQQLEEAVFIGIELLRMNMLSAEEAGGGQEPSKSTKQLITLISRVACLGPLKFTKKLGYSGTLDRSLLTFAWMITAVRTALRDLIETIVVCMFMGVRSGIVERERKDWPQLAFSLPFATDNGCALGIVTKTYLGAVEKDAEDGSALSNSIKERIKAQEKPYTWFRNIEVGENLDIAWGLWDAIYAGAMAAGNELKDTKNFTEANEWLLARK